jgi:SAM-dependent methyltransferase
VITPERASAIAHGDMPFHNPIAQPAIEGLVDLLGLDRTDHVLDVGCGRGELLIRIAERAGARGHGIDASEEQIELARAEAAARAPGEHLVFEVRDAAAMVAPAGGSTAAACVGSSHALGGLEATLARLRELVKPDGYLLLGEGFWQQEPADELLDLLGAAPDELGSLPDLLEAGEAHGLELVYLASATDEDWRRYEWGYILNLDRYLSEHPEEPGAALLSDRRDRMRRRRLLAAREGEAMGFALLAWRRP